MSEHYRAIEEQEERDFQRSLEGGDDDDWDEEDLHGSHPIDEPDETDEENEENEWANELRAATARFATLVWANLRRYRAITRRERETEGNGASIPGKGKKPAPEAEAIIGAGHR